MAGGAEPTSPSREPLKSAPPATKVVNTSETKKYEDNVKLQKGVEEIADCVDCGGGCSRVNYDPANPATFNAGRLTRRSRRFRG